MIALEIKDLIALGYRVEYDYAGKYGYRWFNKNYHTDDKVCGATPAEAWQDAAKNEKAEFKMKPIHSPAHTWVRICRAIAVYGGEFDRAFYKKLLERTEECAEAISHLQEDGVYFSRNECFWWSYELCGSFEVTHPKYVPPLGTRLPEADVLYFTLSSLFGMNPEEKISPEEEKALTIADYEEVIADHKRCVRELDVLINGNKAARQATLSDIIKQLKADTQKVWILKDSDGEYVMMCPKKPTEEFVTAQEDKIQKLISVDEFLLFKQ